VDPRHDFPPPRTVQELFSLEGRVALVTGGAGMYGSGISSALAEAGALVYIASRNLANCEQKAAELRARGHKAVAAELDLTLEDSIARLAERIAAECGKLDVLFNNAVARSVGGDFSTVTAQQWAETLQVNSVALLTATRTFASLMLPHRKGSIVNIASIYGMVGPQFEIYGNTGMKNPAEYAFAKGGMIALTRYLASYWGPYGIRVNCISPGGYYNNQPQEFVDNYCSRTPLGRMAGPEDIKGLAVFLASDASAYITGANIPLDGGWTCR
jgi:NAD(P)-dependent dehydrogenase (short-subunit alcohol dehydrogenase family)